MYLGIINKFKIILIIVLYLISIIIILVLDNILKFLCLNSFVFYINKDKYKIGKILYFLWNCFFKNIFIKLIEYDNKKKKIGIVKIKYYCVNDWFFSLICFFFFLVLYFMFINLGWVIDNIGLVSNLILVIIKL